MPVMLRLIPVMADPMAMTTVTPIATPSTVSAARTLLARTESRAMTAPSPIRLSTVVAARGSFGPQRDDRVEPRGPAGRVHARRDADADSQDHPDHDRPRGHRGRQRRE